LSILLNKSSENFQAIDLLDSSKLYTPGVHCAYYSALQLVIHYFYVYCGISEAEVKRDIQGGGNSHNYYLNKLVEEIKELDVRNAAQFYRFFSIFKRKRNEADYHNIKIGEVELMEAKEKAKKVKIFLIKACDEGKCEDIYFM